MSSLHVLQTGELYSLHRFQLLKLSEAIVGCPVLAEDVVHEAFLHYAARPSAHDVQSPIAYLVGMVRNLSIELVRKQVRERKALDAQSAQVDDRFATPADPESVATWRSEYRAFKSAMGELREPVRTALQMHLVEGCSIRQIAGRMDISVGKAHALVTEGLSDCARKLGRNGA